MKLYRYEEVVYSLGVDEYDNPIRGTGRIEVVLNEYDVIRETPKGMWISCGYGIKRFVLLEGVRKKYACRTIEDAKISFIARKRRQIEILKKQLYIAEVALSKVSLEDHYNEDI